MCFVTKSPSNTAVKLDVCCIVDGDGDGDGGGGGNGDGGGGGSGRCS